jgi:DNA processing protein
MNIDYKRIIEVALSLNNKIKMDEYLSLLELTGSVESLTEIGDIYLKDCTKVNIEEEILNQKQLSIAHAVIEESYKNGIELIFHDDERYSKRLLECNDAPLVLFSIGKSNFNTDKVLSIVGTRRATKQALINTEELVSDLASLFPDLIIVSGLAFGIDICAHRAAIKNGLNTIGVLANGLHEIYPSEHTQTAREITRNGSIVSEFTYGTPSLPYRFIQRNRIIAGISNACIVMESGIKGGSLHTANFSSGYFRDVFAYPGRKTDRWSEGCNNLIKTNRAALVESAEDVINNLGWSDEIDKKKIQPEIFHNLSENQSILYELLSDGESLNISTIVELSGLEISIVLSELYMMELSGYVTAIPGNKYIKTK